MDNQEQQDWFQDIETIVSEPLNFKSKLAIGEDAYTSLKLKNAVFEAWEVAGVATTAVGGNTGRLGNCRWCGNRRCLGWDYAIFKKSLGQPFDRDPEVH